MNQNDLYLFDRGNSDGWYKNNASAFVISGTFAFFANLTANSPDKKSLAVVLLLVNLITLCSYLLMAWRLTPQFKDGNQYPVDVARYLEWIATCPNLILLVGEFTKENTFTFRIFVYDYLMLISGFLASTTTGSISTISLLMSCIYFVLIMQGLHFMFTKAIAGGTLCVLDKQTLQIAHASTMVGWTIYIIAKAFLTIVLVNATIEQTQSETVQNISGIVATMEKEFNNTEAILEKVFPSELLPEIKEGNFPEAKDYKSVTIFFSDITNFNSITSKSSTRDVLKTLDALWTKYEEIGRKWGICKVETIGDAFLGISGCPTRTDNHAENCLNFALEIIEMAKEFKTSANDSIHIRIGIHSGPVVAGFMGTNNPRWCILGDAVNTASRIETLSKPMKINISESTFELVKEKNLFEFSEPHIYEIRGKGRFNMYWVAAKPRSINRNLVAKRFQQTFASQGKVPRLPIPTLENLEQKYLKSCQPLLAKEDYEKTEAIVKEFLSKVDHPEQPSDLLTKPPPKGVLTSFQIKRAAGLITNLLNFNDMLNNQTFPVEAIKGTPLCMNQYKNIFGTTRLPGKTSDTLSHQYPTTAKHIIVLTKNEIYKVQVLADDGKRVSNAELERVLLNIGKETLVDRHPPHIGVLTAGDRDTWYEASEKLCALSPSNVKNFDIIKDSLFAVCLDDHSTKKNLDLSLTQIFHNNNAQNRWFDKSLQLIITNSGRAGLNGEHTPSDAVVPGNVMDYIISHEPSIDPQNTVQGQYLPPPQRLEWVVDDSVNSLIEKARGVAQALIDDTESTLLQTDYYGSRFMKEIAKTSPDAYIQIALQLAYYRLHQKPTAVYESASTRFFKHGRTETGRSMSNESLEFISTFDNDDVLYDTKRELFRKAIATQSNYMKDAAYGKGIDRHMLGLRCMIKPDEMEKATMFTDPAYITSMTFRLSSSNMSPGRNFYGGFGPVVFDGYGINYAIDKDNLKFSISAKRSCTETKIYRLRDELEKVFKDLCILFPKRSEIWGKNWRKEQQAEKVADIRFAKMKTLSDEYLSKQASLAEKYLDRK
ncbi:hypothetical protein HDV01_005475 [Terramyces sp. JEL0728]|nr:hypothetical protein HDV01_005475 [Terramyces sp. JEL0728]